MIIRIKDTGRGTGKTLRAVLMAVYYLALYKRVLVITGQKRDQTRIAHSAILGSYRGLSRFTQPHPPLGVCSHNEDPDYVYRGQVWDVTIIDCD